MELSDVGAGPKDEMESPVVSVMMAAYNTQDYIKHAVQSVLSQTFRDFELLILDDGSTDGTGAILRQLAAEDGRIRLISRPNAGIVATRNELLHLARGEFVAVLDSDDIAMPRRLQMSVDYLRGHPDVLAVGGQVEVIDPDGDALCEWRLPLSHLEIDAHLLSGMNVALCHSAATMRRAAMLEIGGYRDLREFRGQAEDFDLWLRLSERGPIVNLPERMVRYRLRLSGASISGASRQASAAEAALADAVKRRNIPAGASRRTPDPPASVEETLLSWGWWALGSRNIATARKHAVRGIRRRPFSLRSWKLLICALRGY